ncbi:hypothetical protein D6833_05815, partial [Candidatus Parcubacteria bacterium]
MQKGQKMYRVTISSLAAIVTIALITVAGSYWQETGQRLTAVAKEATATITVQPTPPAEPSLDVPDQQVRFIFARQLAAEAELAIQSGEAGSLSRGMLLAIESLRQYHTMEGDAVMRRALALAPHLAFRLSSKKTKVQQIVFDPRGRWIAASHVYTHSVTIWNLSTGEAVATLPHKELAYRDRVNSLAFNPTGSLIATTTSNGTAHLWETDTWQEIARLQHDPGGVYGATFSADGNLLATYNDKTVYLWNVSTGKEAMRLEHENSLRSIAFSPYGKWLATAEREGSNVWIWDAETGEKIAQLRHNSIVETMTFSPYGKWLATASGDTAQVWEITTGRLVMRVMHRDVVNDLAFNPDSTLLATGSKDNTARIWEISTGREVQQLAHKSEVFSVEFSPDGASLATGSGYPLAESLAQIWNVETGQEITRIEHPKAVEYASFSPDGGLLATRDWKSNEITVWDLSPGGPPEVLRADGNIVKAVTFSADGSRLVSGDAGGFLRVWDTASWMEITPAPMKHEKPISALALSPDGGLLAAGSEDGIVSVWNLASGKEIMRMRHPEKYSRISDVTFSPDGKLLATADGNGHTVRLWNVATGEEVARATHSGGVGYPVRKTIFSPDGKYLASAGGGEVRILQAPDWKEIALLKHSGANDIAFNPDGTLLASSGNDDMARVWDTTSWTEIVHMKHNDRDGVVPAVAFSPDGKILATGSRFAITRLWDVNTWEEIGRIPVGVDNLIFSPDGKQLFTRRDYSNIVQIWDVPSSKEMARFEFPQKTWDMALIPDGRFLAVASGWSNKGGELAATMWQTDDLTSEACARLRRNLTLSEWEQYMGHRPYTQTCPGLPIPAASFWDTIDIIEQNLCLDKPEIAAARYEVAVSLSLQARIDANNAYKTCQYGTKEGFAEMVLPACDRAVELLQDKPFALNARGIARALTGDREGALEDLNAVVEEWEGSSWASRSRVAARSKQLIEIIESGQDITPYVPRCDDFTAIAPAPAATRPPT